jgi:hypothetical protein
MMDYLPGCENAGYIHGCRLLLRAPGTLLHEVIVLPGCADHFGVGAAEDCGQAVFGWLNT